MTAADARIIQKSAMKSSASSSQAIEKTREIGLKIGRFIEKTGDFDSRRSGDR
jgi:hypothetical protein